jgi:small subunit ribosomal protein S1
LSLKRMSKDPWDGVDLKLGQEVEGKVQNINHFGVFVEIASNVNGLLHSENIKTIYGEVEKSPYKLNGTYKFVISGLDKIKHRMALEIPSDEKKKMKGGTVDEKAPVVTDKKEKKDSPKEKIPEGENKKDKK